MQILTNHIGYDSIGPKAAVIQGKATDRCESVRLLDHATGKEILNNKPVAAGAVPGWKDWFFWTADFSSITLESTYRLECSTSQGIISSAPFLIQAQVLERQALSNVVAYFKSMRCSGANDRADRRITFESDSSHKVVDVHGGWYDATADYGKHLSHLCFSTYFNPQQLPMVAWSLLQSIRELHHKGDPNYRQLLRRMQDEALFGADYLVRIHRQSGSFYITVSGFGPEKRPADRRLSPAMRGFKLADPEKKDAYAPTSKATQASLYESSFRSGAGVSIAALAAASTCGERGDYDSPDYLETAEDAFIFLENHNSELTNDGRENIVDDYCALLAAAELFKASNKELYLASACRRAHSLMDRLVTSEIYANFWRADDHDRPFFHAADAGFPLLSLLAYLGIAPDPEKPIIKDAIQRSLLFELSLTSEVTNPFGYARQLVQNKAGGKHTAFFFPHDTETAPWWQGENARLASLASIARLASPHFKSDKHLYNQLQVLCPKPAQLDFGLESLQLLHAARLWPQQSPLPVL